MRAPRQRQQTGDKHAVDVKQQIVFPGAMPSPSSCPKLHALATSLAWVRIAISGVPVVPPVQR